MLASLFGLVLLFSSPAHENSFAVDQDSASFRVRPVYSSDTTGRPVTINRIFIVGNRITRDRIILRELTLRPGDQSNTASLPEIFDRDKKRLINTRLFNTVEIRPLELAPDTIDILVNLNERWYTFPSPIFELSDRNFNEWWQNYNHDFDRVNYGIRLYQFNMRGRNETLRLTAQFGFQRKFEFSYRIPYIDQKQKQGLIFDFDFQETKNLAAFTEEHKLKFVELQSNLKITRGGAITYLYRNSFYQTHALKVEYRSTSIADTIIRANPRYFTNMATEQRYGAVTYSFISDHRDYFAYPLKGHHFTLMATKFGISGADNLNKVEATLTYSKYLTLKNNFFFSDNLVGSWSAPDNVPYANFTAQGYKKQFVKGYEVYVIEGPYYFLNKMTFKKLLFSRRYNWKAMPIDQFRHIPLQVYLKTYADVGYVKNYPDYEKNTLLSDKLVSGVGGGLDVVSSYDMVLRFEYTFNAEGQNGFFFHVRKEF